MIFERILMAAIVAGLLWSSHYSYTLGVLDGYIAARWCSRTKRVGAILKKHGLKTHNERCEEDEQ